MFDRSWFERLRRESRWMDSDVAVSLDPRRGPRSEDHAGLGERTCVNISW